jgi:Predicted pyridoxal phosphate-dependent enzyme apparently involved in regulation of cell wall biogenesis
LPFVQCGATPVFGDVDKDTFVIDTKSIEKKISSKTKAIIPVSLYGLSPDYDALNKLKEVNGIKVLGDHAECFLGKYNNRVVGSIDDAASFSFQSSKHLTSGEGGMVVTSDEEFAVKLRRIQSLGYIGVGKNAKIKKEDIQDPSYYRHGSLGWNYRMPELCARGCISSNSKNGRISGVQNKCWQVI